MDLCQQWFGLLLEPVLTCHQSVLWHSNESNFIVLVSLICDTVCSEIAFLKSLPHPLGVNELRRFKSPATRLFNSLFSPTTKKNIKVPHYCPFVTEIVDKAEIILLWRHHVKPFLADHQEVVSPDPPFRPIHLRPERCSRYSVPYTFALSDVPHS